MLRVLSALTKWIGVVDLWPLGIGFSGRRCKVSSLRTASVVEQRWKMTSMRWCADQQWIQMTSWIRAGCMGCSMTSKLPVPLLSTDWIQLHHLFYEVPEPRPPIPGPLSIWPLHGAPPSLCNVVKSLWPLPTGLVGVQPPQSIPFNEP